MPKFPALHTLVDQRGLSLDGLATELELPVSQVAFWMIGSAPVPGHLVERVAALLDVPPDMVGRPGPV